MKAATVAALGLAVGCSVGRARAPQPLRVTVTESAGDIEFAVISPVREVTCIERDHRRAPNDPAATRVIWAARCTAGDDCLPSVHYGDARLETITAPARLTASTPGTCYECLIAARDGRGAIAFRVTDHGAFAPCSPRLGDV